MGIACALVGRFTGQLAPLLLCGIPLSIAWAAATRVPRAVRVCRAWRGGECPDCKHEQDIRWYSQ